MKGRHPDTPIMENGKSRDRNDLDSFASQVRNIDLNNTSLESLIQSLKGIFSCEAINIYIYDNSRKDLYAQNFQSQGPDEIRVDISFNNLISYVAATGKPLNIHDVYSSKELHSYHDGLVYDPSREEFQGVKTRSAMVIPLPNKNKLVGVMEIVNKNEDKFFPETDFIKAKAISLVVGLALVKIEERKEKNGNSSVQVIDLVKARKEKHQGPPKKIVDLDERLNSLSQAINRVKNPDELFFDLQHPLMELFDATSTIIFAASPQRNELFSKIKWNESNQEIRLPINPSSIAGFAAANNQLLNIRDVNDPDELKKYHPDLQFNEKWEKASGLTTQSLLTVPLMHSNKLMGVLQLVNKRSKNCFIPDDANNALLIAKTLAHAIHNLDNLIKPKPKKFSYLVDKGYLTEEELNQVIKKSRESDADVESLLIKDLYLRSRDVGKSLENYYNTPYTGYDESIVLPNLDSFDIKYQTLVDHVWVPLKKDDSGIVILVNDPSDNDTIKEIKRIFPNQNIDIRVGLKMDIQKYVNTFYGVKNISDSIEKKDLPGEDKLDLKIEEERQPVNATGEISKIDSCNKLFDEIVSIAIHQDVTDIHIEPGMDGKNLLVRLRKEGACRIFEEIPSNFQADLISHVKKLANLDTSINNLPQNGKFIWTKDSNKYELSVVIFPTIGDLEDAMIRVLLLGKAVPTFKSMTEMDFSDPNLDKIMSRIHSTKGLILLTGPDGTGKTTTLHALLSHLNTPDKKIVTVENPVEIVQSGLRQLQMNESSGLSYPLAIQTFLLGNPDIILVGEFETDETLKLCVDAAKERLVFSSLKSKSAIDAIRKMREMNIKSNQLGDTFLLVMAQKLVPSLCNNCKEDYHPSQEEFHMLEKFYGDNNFSDLEFQYNENLTLKKAVGCKQCIFTGYSDKIALHEVLERTPELNRLIADNVPMEEIHNQAIKDGMITLNQDAIYKIVNGDCDFKKIQEAFLPGRF